MGTVSASDSPGDPVSYAITAGNDAGTFAIDASTGDITVAMAIDAQTPSPTALTVEASDPHGSTDQASVAIHLFDLRFSSTSLRVDEGSTATYTVVLTSAPSGGVTVQVASSDLEAASVSPTSLTFSVANWSKQETLTVEGIEDTDGRNERLPITHTASGGGYDGVSRTMMANVDDDDSLDLLSTAPRFSEGRTTTRTVAEGTAAGEGIGHRIAASSAYGALLTYQLDGDDALSFDITRRTGQLSTKAPLDYETKSSYEVTVRVSGDGLSDSISVTIEVTNVDEPGVVTVSRDQSPGGAALAADLTDPDGGVTNTSWQWASSPDGTTWADIAGATSSRVLINACSWA